MALTQNQRGALFMVMSQVAYIFNDALVKITSTHLGVGQIMAVRGFFASAIILLLVWRLGHMRSIALAIKPLILVRVIGEMGATITYIIALSHLPIANVSALFQSLPLVVTMSAALFFGEKVGPRRWLAITAGFFGILLIVRPGFEGFSSYSIYVIVCVLFCVFRDLATRSLPTHIPSMFVSMLTSVGVTICGVFFIPFSGGWKPMSTLDLFALIGAAVILLVGYQFIINAMRSGDISFVAPFRYTNLLWAISVGIVVFGDMPDMLTIIGSAIVVASGVYALYRERVVARGRPIAESTASSIAADGL